MSDERERAGSTGREMIQRDARVKPLLCADWMRTQSSAPGLDFRALFLPVFPSPSPTIPLPPLKGGFRMETESSEEGPGRIGFHQLGMCVSVRQQMCVRNGACVCVFDRRLHRTYITHQSKTWMQLEKWMYSWHELYYLEIANDLTRKVIQNQNVNSQVQSTIKLG